MHKIDLMRLILDVTHIMGPGKGLKVATTPDKGHGADNHEGQHNDEDDPSRVGDARHEAKDSRGCTK